LNCRAMFPIGTFGGYFPSWLRNVLILPQAPLFFPVLGASLPLFPIAPGSFFVPSTSNVDLTTAFCRADLPSPFGGTTFFFFFSEAGPRFLFSPPRHGGFLSGQCSFLSFWSANALVPPDRKVSLGRSPSPPSPAIPFFHSKKHVDEKATRFSFT